MTLPGYIDTYYAATLGEHKQFPALEENLEVDVCVIGGGSGGLSVAAAIRERLWGREGSAGYNSCPYQLYRYRVGFLRKCLLESTRVPPAKDSAAYGGFHSVSAVECVSASGCKMAISLRAGPKASPRSLH